MQGRLQGPLYNNIVIHGDIVRIIIMLHLHTLSIIYLAIKLAEFGCWRLYESKYCNKPRGIIPYMDPKILNDETHEAVI